MQFLWTERHTKHPTKLTLVTTRSSGDSFFSLVELQTNLFIPPTLSTEPYDQDRQFDDYKHQNNTEAALQQ